MIGKHVYYMADNAIAVGRVIGTRLQQLNDGGEEIILSIDGGLQLMAADACWSLQELFTRLNRDFWASQGQPRKPIEEIETD